jgi:hypothetical protein
VFSYLPSHQMTLLSYFGLMTATLKAGKI